MATNAKRNQIFGSVVTQVTLAVNVVYLQIRHVATALTPPSIALENLSVEIAVICRSEADTRVPRS